ncbi:hypothetical protein HanXRQr2_Chr09g0406801 [Helianthus annuus]|uniref:Uncharacterized protein n=1 Tax=Helianthus annuus TaxID=4232 RepID=A0A9K3IAC4_HELAN|nr:hypothetical protein HanXRQr2_Chr09g0406801 [Helianthus annuus]
MLAYMYLGKSNNPSCWSANAAAAMKGINELVPKGVSRAMVDLEMSFYARISWMEDNMMLRRFN